MEMGEAHRYSVKQLREWLVLWPAVQDGSHRCRIDSISIRWDLNNGTSKSFNNGKYTTCGGVQYDESDTKTENDLRVAWALHEDRIPGFN